MDVDSDSLRCQTPIYSNTIPLTQPSKKRYNEEAEDKQQARPVSKKRRTLSDTSGDASLVPNTHEETSMADPSRQSNISDVGNESPTISIPKRKRVSPDSSNRLPPSSPFDPPE